MVQVELKDKVWDHGRDSRGARCGASTAETIVTIKKAVEYFGLLFAFLPILQKLTLFDKPILPAELQLRYDLANVGTAIAVILSLIAFAIIYATHMGVPGADLPPLPYSGCRSSSDLRLLGFGSV